MKTIAQGAESIIKLDKEVVIKDRFKKAYRLPIIDETLRKSRTKSEAKILQKLIALDFPVPKVLRQEKSQLVLEYVDAPKLRDTLTSRNAEKLGKELGVLIKKLHDQAIIHGDLTTSNMLATKKGIYLIDFGLSFHSHKVEDKAVDLHLLRQALESKHYKFWEKAYKAVIKSYNDKEVIERLEIVEGRGRNKEKY